MCSLEPSNDEIKEAILTASDATLKYGLVFCPFPNCEFCNLATKTLIERRKASQSQSLQ